MIERRLSLTRPLSLQLTLGALRQGRGDPCTHVDSASFWRATRTPEGPALVLLQKESRDEVRLRTWGAGAQWCADQLPECIGEHQEDSPIHHPAIQRFARELQGMRIPCTRALVELAVPIILGQRVTTMEAFRAYRGITRALSEPAPGPNPHHLYLPPPPERLANTPTWWFHRFGVERKRAQTIVDVARRAKRIDSLADLPAAEARRLLTEVPGIGLWTAGTLGLYALGDVDSVIIGDFHFPHHVAWALAGEVRGDDRRMLELLEPFRGQRGRVLRLIVSSTPSAPKFGPRYAPLPIASF